MKLSMGALKIFMHYLEFAIIPLEGKEQWFRVGAGLRVFVTGLRKAGFHAQLQMIRNTKFNYL